MLSRIIRVINQAQRPGRGSGGVWGGGWGGSAEGRGWSRGRLTEVLRQQASFSRAVMSSDRAEWRSAAWPEGASHTVKTFSFTRDSCHFLSAEVPSTQPPPTSLRPPSRQHDVQTGTMSGRRFKKNKNKLTTKNQTKNTDLPQREAFLPKPSDSPSLVDGGVGGGGGGGCSDWRN